MPSYYLYERQAEKLRGMKAPATQIIGRAYKRYLAGELSSGLAFLKGKNKSSEIMPKTRVSVNRRFPAVDDEMMRKILDAHFASPDSVWRMELDRRIAEEERKISKMMDCFTKRKYIMAK